MPCPAMTRHVACSDCGLCFNDPRSVPLAWRSQGIRERGYSIAFEVHGIPFAKPDDPDRRIPSEERIRIVRDRYLRVEKREPTVREVMEMVDLNSASVAEWLRYLRGEIVHPAERRRRAREIRSLA